MIEILLSQTDKKSQSAPSQNRQKGTHTHKHAHCPSNRALSVLTETPAAAVKKNPIAIIIYKQSAAECMFVCACGCVYMSQIKCCAVI